MTHIPTRSWRFVRMGLGALCAQAGRAAVSGSWLALILVASCVHPGVPVPPGWPPVPIYTFGVVACAVPVALADPCPSPIAGATIQVNASAGYVPQTADAHGYALFTSVLPFSDVKIHADGYADGHANLQPPTLDKRNISVSLTPLQAAFPAPPTRAEILNVHITFQGLMVDCQPFGSMPLFEAALAWMTPACRANVYAAKHASNAWPGGDTHALIMLPSGPALYDEPHQPYSADRFGPLDWTGGGAHIDGRLADLVAEVIRAGFRDVLLFEGGDGPNGQPIAMQQLGLISAALTSTPYGDLRPYVVVIPGWDSVFYGWEPSHVLIPAWIQKCRSLFSYCGIEHGTGHIPLGEGDADWTGPGVMRGIDLLLEEFNDDSYGDSIWQIAARVLGPAYVRPPDQPAVDDPGAPFGLHAGQFILREPTERGPIVPCAFEFHEFSDVHSNGGAAELANTVTQREYLKRIGYACGG